MRIVPSASYLPLIATMLLSCVEPSPAPPPISGPRSAGTKAGDDGAAGAASPHVGDKEKKTAGPTAPVSPVQVPTPGVLPAPASQSPWSPQATVTSPSPVTAGSQSPPTDNLGSVLSSLLGAGAGALGGASLGGFLGDLIGNQQLGTLLGSIAGATLGGGLAQGTGDPTK